MIDLNQKKVVIIGAGKVAERKVSLLINYTNITIINTDFSDKLKQKESAGQVTLLTASPRQISDDEFAKIFASAFLVIPATNDKQLNSHITDLAKLAGALTNQVDCVGEVILPSVINTGNLTIGISTNGTSPALSKYTRKKIEELVTPEYEKMALLQNEMREYYKQEIPDQQQRKQMLWAILSNKNIWQALSESYDKALKIAKTN